MWQWGDGVTPDEKRDFACAWLIGIGAALLVAVTLPQYGVTYDEPLYLTQGQRYTHWAVDQLRLPEWHIDQFLKDLGGAWGAEPTWHPPLVPLMSAVFGAVFGFLPGLVAFRLFGALLFGVMAGAMFNFLRVPVGRMGALFAVLALVTLPRLFAHAHFAALDLPVTALVFLATLQFATAAHADEPGARYVTGTLFGLGLLTKLSAALMPLYLIPWALIAYRNRALRLTISLLFIGGLVFFAGWPWLWPQPFGNIKSYLNFHFNHYPVAAYFLGQNYARPPWYYALTEFAVTTPITVLFLALLGIVAAIKWHPYRAHRMLLVLGAAVPIAAVSLPSQPAYNGERLLLPALPFVACLAGLGFQWFGDGVRAGLTAQRASRAWSRIVLGFLGALLLLPGAYGLIATHPYQLAFYDISVQGPRGAWERGFETIYWGQPFMDAARYLNTRPAQSVYVTPPGAASLLDFYRGLGILTANVVVTHDEPNDTPPQRLARARAADLVIFQGMQSEFDETAWALYRNGVPVWGVTATGDPVAAGKPVDGPAIILAYDAAEVRRVLPAR